MEQRWPTLGVAGPSVPDDESVDVPGIDVSLCGLDPVFSCKDSLSIVGLSVRRLSQPFLSFFHTYASKLQFFLCLSLLFAYTLFMLGGFPDPGSWMCVAAAVGTHWGFLSAMLWMNVNAVQIWRNFRPGNYGTCGPQITMDQLDPDESFSPRYGQGQCWFNGGKALLFFFIVPTCLLSAVNLVLTVLITYSVHTRRCSTVTRRSSVLLEVKACFKLVVLVGVTWLLGIPVTIFDEPVLGDVFTLANATLGLFITIAIMGNRPVTSHRETPASPAVDIQEQLQKWGAA
nr:hypothetical protein BaRGS_032179 [Batillaria attramentaria]